MVTHVQGSAHPLAGRARRGNQAEIHTHRGEEGLGVGVGCLYIHARAKVRIGREDTSLHLLQWRKCPTSTDHIVRIYDAGLGT